MTRARHEREQALKSRGARINAASGFIFASAWPMSSRTRRESPGDRDLSETSIRFAPFIRRLPVQVRWQRCSSP
jgi:hypothetical protein